MRLLGEAISKNRSLFSPFDTFADDLEISLTLKQIGVPAVYTHDADGRQLFMTLGVDYERTMVRAADPKHWYWAFVPGATEGRECCSKRWIASHYTSPAEMYLLHDLHAMGCEAAGMDPP